MCGETFGYVVSLQKHMSHHGIYSCSFCDKLLGKEETLKAHIENQHSHKFKCSECDAAFNKKTELKRHLTNVHAPPRKVSLILCLWMLTLLGKKQSNKIVPEIRACNLTIVNLISHF